MLGGQVLFLGRHYVLNVISSLDRRVEVKLRGNRLEVLVSNPTTAKIRTLMRQWYRTRAAFYLGRRVQEISNQLPWVEAPPPLRIQMMVSQWGNCSPDGQIVLNPHLVKAPRDGIDYVVIHELANLKHLDHGAEFWRLLDQNCPNWRDARAQLDSMVEVITNE